MGDKTNIEWTDSTWNPIRGCSRVSPGCINCYAELVAKRFSGPGLAYEGTIGANGRWNGVIKVPQNHMADPVRWTRPRRIFVNSMSDLFHPGVNPATLHQILSVMQQAPQHEYQVLTKRPERILDALKDAAEAARQPRSYWLDWGSSVKLRIGASIESEAYVERVKPIVQLARIGFDTMFSLEPMLGPMTSLITEMERDWCTTATALPWLVFGGESGRGAREFAVEWAVELVAANKREVRAPLFAKQLGSNPSFRGRPLSLKSQKGSEAWEWPVKLPREFPA